MFDTNSADPLYITYELYEINLRFRSDEDVLIKLSNADKNTYIEFNVGKDFYMHYLTLVKGK